MFGITAPHRGQTMPTFFVLLAQLPSPASERGAPTKGSGFAHSTHSHVSSVRRRRLRQRNRPRVHVPRSGRGGSRAVLVLLRPEHPTGNRPIRCHRRPRSMPRLSTRDLRRRIRLFRWTRRSRLSRVSARTYGLRLALLLLPHRWVHRHRRVLRWRCRLRRWPRRTRMLLASPGALGGRRFQVFAAG